MIFNTRLMRNFTDFVYIILEIIFKNSYARGLIKYGPNVNRSDYIWVMALWYHKSPLFQKLFNGPLQLLCKCELKYFIMELKIFLNRIWVFILLYIFIKVIFFLIKRYLVKSNIVFNVDQFECNFIKITNLFCKYRFMTVDTETTLGCLL